MATVDVDGPSTRIHIPADKVCWVIGQRGATIKDIQRKTGTIVQVTRTTTGTAACARS